MAKPDRGSLECWRCGAPDTRIGGRVAPSGTPGDAILCGSCGNWSIRTDNLFLRKPSKREAKMLAQNPMCQREQKRWQAEAKVLEIPPEAWGEGCQIDWEKGSLTAPDGTVYRNIMLRREDVMRLWPAPAGPGSPGASPRPPSGGPGPAR